MYNLRLHTAFVFLLLSQVGAAQKAATAGTSTPSSKLIHILRGELSFDQEKSNAKLLTNNVICEHEGALLYCDTAMIYDGERRMEASGHIRITKGDSITVTGDRLLYDSRSKMAKLENNVRCVEKDMVLTTNYLDFDVGNSVANYYSGGTLVNKQNTLISQKGHYYSATKDAVFHEDVVLTNPEYKMESDTLRYHVPSRTAYFFGPSLITSKTDYIYCENGWYNTEKEQAQFSRNALLVTAQQKLRGDSLYYDRKQGIGRAFRHVSLVDTSQKSIIYGDYIEYKQKKSEALVTQQALYAKIMDADTLFIAADTLYHRDIDSTNNFLNAYHHVRIYKPDMQGLCDSASMNTKDSLLHMFRNPVLWNGRSQATARLISVDVWDKTVHGFHLDGKAFLIQQADTINKFNQLSGRQIDGILSNDSIRRITVSGNADAIYYPKNKNKTVGQNKTTCSEIVIWFAGGEVERATFKPKTEGVIDPIKTADIEGSRLKGFNWIYEKRPKSRWDLHKR